MTGSRSGSDPAEAAGLFELLSDETRVRIIGELYEQCQRTPDAPCLPFSALYDRVGGDDSGRFNYHLKRLREGLVEKRGDGYALTPLGVRLASLVADGGPAPGRI